MAASRALFDGLPEEVLGQLLTTLERRSFPAGSVVVAEGDVTRTVFVVDSGSAEAFVADQRGIDRPVGRIRPGGTIGEMAAFTGQPAAATVRASEDLEVVLLGERDFDDLAARHPELYRNLGAILADRLARTNRLAARRPGGNLVLLQDEGAPPLLALALAASIAWHARASTLLVVLGEPSPELREIVTPVDLGEARGTLEARAHVFLAADARGFTSTSLPFSIDDLRDRFEYVVVHAAGEPPQLDGGVDVVLAAAGGGTPGGGRLLVRGWERGAGRLGPDPSGVLRVPEPDPDELDRLRGGSLSSSGTAGGAIGWAARDVAGLKVGLALGAGSFRGYAHAGVLQVLARVGLPVDVVSGTSIGSAVGAMHAIGMTPMEIFDALDTCAAAVFRPTIPVKSFLSSRALVSAMREFAGGRRIEDLPMPFAAVAADIDTHQEVVLRRGDLALAVAASISIPGIYPAQRVGSRTLVDGGVLDPVPVTVVAEMGADQVIGVKLGGPPAEWVYDALAAETGGPTPAALPLILRAIEIMQARIAIEPTVPTIFLAPSFAGIPQAGLRRFKANGRRYLERGLEAAEEALPRLEAAFPWIKA